MAINDIYFARFFFDTNENRASFGVHYREKALFDDSPFGAEALAKALDLVFGGTVIRDLIASDVGFAGIRVDKLWDEAEPPTRIDIFPPLGTRPAPSLPSDNAMNFGLNQGTLGAKSNGLCQIPGISEDDSDVGVLRDTLDAQRLAFNQALLADVPEVSPGTGIWEPGVLSRKILNLSPPAEDWLGAFGRLQSINSLPIIGTRRPRKSRVGAANIV